MARRKRNALFQKKGKSAKGSRGRKALIWAASIVGGLFLLVIIGFFQLLSWLQGDGFRTTMETKLSNKTKSDITIPANLSIDGSTVRLPEFTAEHTGLMKRASAKRITAEVDRGQLLDSCLHITKMVVEDLSITLDTLKEPEKKYEDSKGSSFFSRFAPEHAIVDHVECTNAGASLTVRRSGDKRYIYSLKGCTFSATPDSKDRDQWQVSIKNGSVSTPHSYLPDGNIKSASMQYADKRLSLTDCHIVLTQGHMDMTGFYQTDDKTWNATIGVGNADVKKMLSETWQERLSAEISGSIKLTGKSKKLLKANGHIALHKGSLKALRFIPGPIDIPGQELLTDYIEDNFTTVGLKEATCRISYPFSDTARKIKDAWLFDSINIRTKDDTIRVCGRVIIEQDGSLHGVITVGLNKETVNDMLDITKGTLRTAISACLPKLFNAEGEEGFYWVNINLSGTNDDPQQDFSVRLQEVIKASGVEIMLEEAANTARKGLSIIPGLGNADSEDEAPAQDDNTQQPADETDSTPDKKTDKPSSGGSLIDTATDTAGDVIDAGIKAIPFL